MSRWIKCSERMPPFVGEQSKPVLVWGDGYEDPEIGIFHEYDGWDAWGVTHWRPLPSFLDDEMIQDIISKLKALQSNPDKEAAHSQADKILCDLLNSLGYDDVVKEFENLEKWYA
ncbi:MAG: DUF551 domain-containing protein [Haemophilus parainfluenzae]|nr:DUF551 domain-containing protein [Haemophilus parainfluenzae]